MTRPYDQTPKDNHILCSRCGEVANRTNAWYHGWPVAGLITLKANSVIHWGLLRKVTSEATNRSTKDPHVEAVTSGKHPAIKKFGYQEIIIEYGHDKPYRLCGDCHSKLKEMVGEFFFKNIPPVQPITPVPEQDFVESEDSKNEKKVEGGHDLEGVKSV